MLFTSFTFLALLPLALLVFAVLPVRRRWAWLLLASYIFYAAWEPLNLLYLGAVTLVVYGCGLGMAHTGRGTLRAALLSLGLVTVLGLLVTFKFYDFLAGELEALGPVLPRLGLADAGGIFLLRLRGRQLS